MRTDGFKRLSLAHLTGLWVIWGAISASVLMYAVVGVVLGQTGSPSEVDPMLRVLLATGAGAAGVASILLPRHLMREERLRALLRGPIDLTAFTRRPKSNEVDPQKAADVAQLGEEERRMLALLQPALVALIVGLVASEAVALCGLVLAVLTRVPMDMAPFLVATVGLNLYHRPQLEPLWERARRVG